MKSPAACTLREAMSNENGQPAITNRYVKFFEPGVYYLNHSPQWAKLILANASNVTLDGGEGVIIDGASAMGITVDSASVDAFAVHAVDPTHDFGRLHDHRIVEYQVLL